MKADIDNSKITLENINNPLLILDSVTKQKINKEREIEGKIPFTIATIIIKYLGINLPKETKDLYIENNKTLVRDIKEDTNRWRNIPWSWI